MSSTICGITCLSAALLLCGCAVDRGVEHSQLAEMLDEFERAIEARAEPDEVELLAADTLGRRMDRDHRRLSRD